MSFWIKVYRHTSFSYGDILIGALVCMLDSGKTDRNVEHGLENAMKP